jgi:hypothetical protein
MNGHEVTPTGSSVSEDLITATPFTSRAHTQAVSNLAEYIRFAKEDLIALGAELEWNTWKWAGVGCFIKQSSVRFSNCKSVSSGHLLGSGFIEFAKAYIRERHAKNPRKSKAYHGHRLQGLRMLEMALLEIYSSTDPVNIDIAVLNQAASLVRKHFSGNNIYQCGQDLQAIASLLGERQLVPACVGSWVSPIRKQVNLGIAVGSSGEDYRAAKLPDLQALKAMAEIFNQNLNPHNPAHQRNIYTTSITAVLLSAPSRGGDETHHLPVDLVIQATDHFGKAQVGMRWEAGKGFGSYIKWIWEDMAPVVQIALDRLKCMTEEARNLARWMEEPKTAHRFYRHADCPDVDQDEPLTAIQACLALGRSTINPCSSLKQAQLSHAKHAYTLNDLWAQYVLPQRQKYHPYFPFVNAKEAAKGSKGGLKFSEALFCMLAHQLHPGNNTCPVKLWMPSLNHYLHDVGISTESATSIFDRHGYRSSDGEPLRLRSHSLRHLLNTEAQRGKMTN